ncbi:MAG TPA: glycosyltransferase family 4 protein [Gemmataceae bacterium]|nr:glycosyltransferase family 4 protein [Gemmataceae bacterium]
MRIALVSQEYPPETAHGGIGTQTYAKAHGLAALGHEIHIVSHAIGPDRRDYVDGSVRVTRVPGPDFRLPIRTDAARWLAYSVEVTATVACLHARAPFDLIDFPEWAGEGYFHLLNRTDWDRVPTVIHLHGPLVMFAHALGWPEVDSELYRVGMHMEATCVRLADAVLSSSRCSADWCARHYGLDAARVPVLHTGVDTTHFRPGGRKADRPTVIFVGKIAATKGINVLVDAALQAAHDVPGLRLELIGRGEPTFLAGLKARVADAGCPDLLDVIGFAGKDDLPARLARAHVFAAPSLYEGGPGFVYLEAMACGLPAIACSGSGASEVIRDGETGLLVAPGDVDTLAATLRQLLIDTGRREAIGRAARQYVEAEADSRICIRRFEAFYADVAGRRA